MNDRPSGGPVAAQGAPQTAAASAFLKARIPPVRRPLSLAAAAAAINAILLIFQYRLLATGVDAVLFAGRDLAGVWPSLWPIPGFILLRAAVVWAGDAAAGTAAARVKQSVRMDLLDHLMSIGPVPLREERAGALSTLLVEGVEALEPYYARFLPAMASVVLAPLAVLAAVLPEDWLSGLVLLLTAPLIPLFMILIGRGAERLNQRQWSKLARMGAHFLEAFQNLTTLKLFNASRREALLIARMSEDYRLAVMAVLRVAFLSALALEFFATLGVALVAVFIGFRLLDGGMGFERGFFVLLVAPEFYLPLRSMGAHYHARMEAVGAASGLIGLLAHPRPGRPSGSAEGGTGSVSAAPRVVFDAVHLVYGDGRKGLDGADFHLDPGSVTALVGPSGAGKSSVLSVLLGFVPPTAGCVRIDGTALTDMDPEEWRRLIAWVPQAPYLFRGTIADNIRLGFPDADDDAMAAAAGLTGAGDFIRSLPGGYGYEIAEGGGGLSGGQRRLIALTRAALRPAPLVILDEPTASLDRASEKMAGEAIRRFSAGRSVLVVAHRLETVRSADMILVMEGGRVVEQGRHDGLMAAGGLYAGLVRSGEAISAVDGQA
ncbi:thiol reductant ABC exporter subunit CydD [Telmatospirillum siberiense]|uniref:Thiol reductant ABC exporter subunit CydD n=1 Tax=Telmatospirillum siberiense TaxID=382514 RepID=A0A2N3PY61_9PROT|nr:thiol reductant ABC exporter subunit CydD [Telmatospirillum siberiense]PKU25360.1 thiol reductant ABC exporter subunit CydD [Telmatospirillum siberiense]